MLVYCPTSNGSEQLLSASIPYEIGKSVDVHGKTYVMPELRFVAEYTRDVSCATHMEIQTTSGLECSPITAGVVETGEWKHWNDINVAKTSHYRTCSYYNTHIMEYGCALGSHQHCFALFVSDFKLVHLAHLSDSYIAAKDVTSNISIYPDQEVAMPHLGAFDDKYYYENSDAYVIYTQGVCYVTYEDGNITVHPELISLKYDLASMHWHIHHPDPVLPVTNPVEYQLHEGKYIVEIPIWPRSVKLKFNIPSEYDTKCKIRCFKSKADDISNVNEYHGDNVVTILATGSKEYCRVTNAGRNIFIHNNRRERIGISEPTVFNDGYKEQCPYVHVRNWQKHSESTESDYTDSFSIDLKSLFAGLDKFIMIGLCLLLLIILGPNIYTVLIIAVIYYSLNAHTASALPVTTMHKCENLAIASEIFMLVAQALFGSSLYTWMPSILSAILLVAVYPYRSERVNLIASARLFIAATAGNLVYRVPGYAVLTCFRHSPKLHQIAKEAFQKARDAKAFVEIRTTPSTPIIREHSVEAAIARIRVLQRKKGPSSYYFINRAVIRKINARQREEVRRPYLALSRVRQVSGTLFYPEEYAYLRHCIKKLTTAQIIAMKDGSTWVHGRTMWDFSEVIPYAPDELGWLMALASSR